MVQTIIPICFAKLTKHTTFPTNPLQSWNPINWLPNPWRQRRTIFLKQHILTSLRFRLVKARILFLVRQVSVYVKYLHMLWKNLKLINHEDSSFNAKSLLIGKEGHLMCFNPDFFNNAPIKKIEDENLRIGFLSWLFSSLTNGTIN